MNLGELRERTRPEHEATEAVLPLTAPGLRVETYRAALGAMLPVVEGWELWAAENAPARLRSLVAARRRSHLLRADLRELGVDSPSRAWAEEPMDRAAVGADGKLVDWAAVVVGEGDGELSGEEFEAGFMGALYVMEGSTLGGQLIARHAEAVLGLEPGRGNAYFLGHGEATGSMWRETREAIAAVPEAQSGRVIAAAKRAFAAFGAAIGESARDDGG